MVYALAKILFFKKFINPIYINFNFNIFYNFFYQENKETKINYPKNLNFIVFLLLISLIIWMKALDTRYILGVLVSLVSILSILIFINLNFLQRIRKHFSFILVTLLLLLFLKILITISTLILLIKNL